MHLRISMLLTIVMLPLAGCVTDSVSSSTGRALPPEPREAQPAPDAAPINAVAVLKSQRPIDTNGNGFPNRLGVAVYLFSRPYPSPRHADGSLRFRYYPIGSVDPVLGASAEPLATWTFTPDVLQAAKTDDIIGPGYALALDISAIGMSTLDVEAADLVVDFLPGDGGAPTSCTTVQRIPFVIY
ncbi:MAG: hypothetical protein GY895_07435 [Phycisphaera sp.]|nr:hypothetical protein [Phycisphaera sp.]